MRTVLLFGAAAFATGLAAPAFASGHVRSAGLTACSTSVVFGDSQTSEQTLVFRASVIVACPPGVAFEATLRSAGGCRMRSAAGATLRYELFADQAMNAAVVSCGRNTQTLRGSGHRTFLVYGRVEGLVSASGQFNDELVATLAP